MNPILPQIEQEILTLCHRISRVIEQVEETPVNGVTSDLLNARDELYFAGKKVKEAIQCSSIGGQ